ncbi:hypothetical protein [Micromonospora inyonensis]|uniref:Uncharacterized protein n=1 Tax=Micromonospora inyonensis TaxID=47866 RepID=A0A1C6SJD8_9ACTN|nr:hypothetical protein [Micromonospora inyonensis]SCL29518.1 hypothetical protein GA0074694_5426 [Micromonospora inyonensis]
MSEDGYPIEDEEWVSAEGAGFDATTGRPWPSDDGAAAGQAPEAEHAPDPTETPADDEALIEEEVEAPDPRVVISGIEDLFGRLGAVRTGNVRVRGANATGHRAVAINTLTVRTGADGSERVWCEELTATQVRQMGDGYAPTATDELLDQAINRDPLVRLAGADGSGRHSTACLALARRYGPDRVAVLTAADLADLAGVDGLFTSGVGYVVPDPGPPGVDGLVLAGLATRAANRRCTVILLTAGGTEYGLSVPTVVHRAPAPVDVFAAQLWRHLRGDCLGACAGECQGDCVQSYLDDECLSQPALKAYLAGTPRPWEVVQVVAAIAERTPSGNRLARALDQLLPQQVRQRAREILAPSADTYPGGADHLRAFRLSCAVLAGQTVTEIHDAAHRLLRPYLDEPVSGPDAGLRGPDLDALLGGVLSQAVVIEPDDVASSRRRLRFRPTEEELRRNLLDVAWSEWAPERLLGWFGALARSTDSAIRQAGAAAIGWAAGRDVDAALALVDDLARAQRARVRQAAGIALVAMAMQRPLRHRVRTQLSRWASGRAYQRDTVARAYALGLARLWPDVALAQLRLAAQFRSQRWHNSVGRALVDIHESGQSALMLHELARWAVSGEPELCLHAARTFRLLAERWSPAPDDHWPELLDLLRANAVPLFDLVVLLRTALCLPATAYRSWRIVGYWINQADGRLGVADACLELLRAVITTPQLRRRLRHQVRHVWRPIMPQNRLLPAVAQLAVEDLT